MVQLKQSKLKDHTSSAILKRHSATFSMHLRGAWGGIDPEEEIKKVLQGNK
jgi:hypothetical protein